VRLLIISHKHKFIFIKTQKTAGTSIQKALEPYCGPNDVVTLMSPHRPHELGDYRPRNFAGYDSHEYAHIIRERIGPEIWDSYFKFAFARNPWDKVVSQFWFDFGGNRCTPERFVRYVRFKKDESRLGNWAYYTDPKTDEIIVDCIYRFEFVERDYQALCETIGIPYETLPRLKTDIRNDDGIPYQTYYDDETRQRVAENEGCKNEIRYFGYTF